eukprot:m.80951 g.80951  ORF g.80951 m.80951 type:complete len:197 (-) comp14861_c0_seq3:874-1464(-)
MAANQRKQHQKPAFVELTSEDSSEEEQPQPTSLLACGSNYAPPMQFLPVLSPQMLRNPLVASTIVMEFKRTLLAMAPSDPKSPFHPSRLHNLTLEQLCDFPVDDFLAAARQDIAERALEAARRHHALQVEQLQGTLNHVALLTAQAQMSGGNQYVLAQLAEARARAAMFMQSAGGVVWCPIPPVPPVPHGFPPAPL